MTVITSASGLLAMLEEEEDELKLYALKNLTKLADQFWAEISASISSIEALYEDDTFPHRELAALLASKVFYHLGELADSLTYALGAGPLFDVNEDSEFVQTILSKCITEYTELSIARSESSDPDADAPLDPRLVTVVEKMLDMCIEGRQYQQAIGVALECRRIDKVQAAVRHSNYSSSLLAYCLRVSQTLVNRRQFRHEVLKALVTLFEQAETPDVISICQCLMFLDDAPAVAAIIDKLLKGDEKSVLLAYQVAFDLFESEFQQFLLNVRNSLPDVPAAAPDPLRTRPAAGAPGAPAPAPAPASAPAPAAADGAAAEEGEAKEVKTEAEAEAEAAPMETEGGAAEGGVARGTESGAAGASQGASHAAPAAAVKKEEEEEKGEGGDAPEASDAEVAAAAAARSEAAMYGERLGRVKGILSGETPIGLTLQFLFTRNKADLPILKGIKQAVEYRNSVCHSATIFANAVMHAGTTVDTFLRENLEWLSRATNWAKFSATAGLGVIHKGHLQQGRSLMAPYLPQNGVSASAYSEGGALYALGLIHANHGETIRQFLLESLRNASNETIQHGACLGLGLAGLGTADDEAFEDVKGVLYTDSAVAGEAAGIAMGLLMVGSASERAGEMLSYAHDTQHEKIIRGLGLGIALVVYGREEEADTLIEQMGMDQDPIIRYGGMYAIGMAYRGTANNNAIRRLLHYAVSDVSDDVRRAAVLALGFVLCGEPEQMPRIVGLLAESYNPHVRYGAAMAVGIACAGTALRNAVDMLEPLLSDAVDFVRQGALLAMAMVLMQCVEERESRVAVFRAQLDKIIHDKHEDAMTKMGAILATGLLDAGGRNVTISLRSRSGFDRVTATVGMAVFTQFWYWYPLIYFISLSFSATAFIGLNSELRIPKLDVVSECRPSLFAYPPPVSAQASTKTSKAPAAVLSIAARAKGRAHKKDKETEAKGRAAGKEKEKEKGKGKEEKGAMEEDAAGGAGDKGAASASMDVDKGAEKKDGEGAKEGDAMQVDEGKEKAPTSEVLHNPARVLPAQEKYIKFVEGSRYVPIRKAASGFVVLLDTKPEEPEELAFADASAAGAGAGAGGAAPGGAAGAPGSAASTGATSADDEPPPPESFEFSLN